MKLSCHSLLNFCLAALVSLNLAGCSKAEKSSALPLSNEPAGLTQVQFDQLDNTCRGWGQGTFTDADNCPVSCSEFNERYGKYAARFGGDKSAGKTVCLTFDEGYENGCTAAILDTLKEKNCPAVFFVTMDYVKKEPELVQRMLDEGHLLGNHSATHPSMPSLSISKMQDEITLLHDYVANTFRCQMFLFRPPKGEFSIRSLAVAQDLGYTSIFWSFAYKDWITDSQPEPGPALQKMLSAAHPGAIYLLHAVSSTNTAVLGDFIDRMRAEQYRFTTDICVQSAS